MLQSGFFVVSILLVASSSALADSQPTPLQIPKQLLERRLEMARKVFEQDRIRLKGAAGFPSELSAWSERWLDAELALAERPSDRVKPLRDHLDRIRDIERVAIDFAGTGQGRRADADAATYYRLQAEIRLYKEGFVPYPAEGADERK